MYTIKELAAMANISTRTLRYYDEIGLLQPAAYTDAGYRLYSEVELDQLQQVLLFREMELSLVEIKQILQDPEFDIIQALYSQQQYLESEQTRIAQLLHTIDTTITSLKGEMKMEPKDKFQGLKDRTVSQNEDTYGKELRQKYGDEIINQSNIKMRNMSKWQWNHANELGEKILKDLPIAMSKGIDSQAAKDVCKLHQEWIQLYWESYTKEAHIGLCNMYTEDERFTRYYDKTAPGASQFLLDAMRKYLSQ